MSVVILTTDADAAHTLCAALSRSGQQAAWVRSSDDALQQIDSAVPLVLVADTGVPNHQAVAAQLQAAAPWARVVLIGETTPTMEGLFKVIGSPFDASEVAELLLRESELAEMERSRHDLSDRVEGLSLLVDECFEAIVGLSADGIVRSWNPGAQALYGYSADEIIGRSLDSVEFDAEPIQARSKELGPSVRELRRRHKSGREIFVIASLSRLSRTRPGRIELAEVSFDVTERRELEHTERLAEIGRIAAGMAHEINNPLAVIRASAAYIGEVAANSPDPELSACVADIEIAVERIGSFVQHVCGFASREHPRFGDAPLSTTIEIALRMVGPKAKERRVALTVHPFSTLNLAHDPPRLAQAIINVLSNAVDAAENGGRHVSLQVYSGEQTVVIAIDDDGPFVGPGLVGRTFEPLKPNKPFNQGVGWGLPITQKVLQDHGGRVLILTPEGGGTQVRLELPRFRASAYGVLVVDDDDEVRSVLAKDLRREGYDVKTAGSLGEARDMLRRGRVQLIITDFQLPEAGGDELVSALTRECPTARLIATSPDPSVVPHGSVDAVLGKPYERELLLQRARAICLMGERPAPISSKLRN